MKVSDYFDFLSFCLKVEEVKKDRIELWTLFSFSCSVFSHSLFTSHANLSQGQVLKERASCALVLQPNLKYSFFTTHKLNCLYRMAAWELPMNVERVRNVFLSPKLSTRIYMYTIHCSYTTNSRNVNTLYILHIMHSVYSYTTYFEVSLKYLETKQIFKRNI